MRLSLGRGVVVAVAAVISGGLVGLAFFRPVFDAGTLQLVPRFDVATWVARLPSHLPWVVPFVVLTAALPALRASVWRRTLAPPPPRWGQRFHALAIGGLIHNVLPGRLGVLGSAWVLSHHTGAPMPALLSSLLLAKLLEFGALFGVTALVGGIAHARGVRGGPAGALLVGGFAALLVFTVALAAARRYAPRLSVRLQARGGWPRLAAVLGALGAGLHAVGSPRRVASGYFVALAPVMASTLAYGLALRHMGVEAWLLGGGLVVGAITLGQFTPGLPIGVGVYYFVCTSAARGLGVLADDAAALAVLTHAATFATNLLVGVIAALSDHDVLRDLVRFKRAMSATGAVAAAQSPAAGAP